MYSLYIISKKAIYFILCETKKEARQQVKIHSGLGSRIFVKQKRKAGFWL